jgi:ribosomal protein S18 acetylase RimI-like enzyme
VADLDGLVVGFIRFGPYDFAPSAETGALEFIYLAPEFWDQGLGKQMLAAAEQGLASMGFSSAYLAVYEANQRARSFYERNGWAFDGSRWEVDRHGPVAQVRYAKDLS